MGADTGDGAMETITGVGATGAVNCDGVSKEIAALAHCYKSNLHWAYIPANPTGKWTCSTRIAVIPGSILPRPKEQRHRGRVHGHHHGKGNAAVTGH